ncbi:hypothetical protein Erwinia_phage_Papaline_00068 [Erwinia phage Papaline]|nr:hypothetical protein Erwinia_phage_Papaline_00068 [Erwinia phage Papaline]
MIRNLDFLDSNVTPEIRNKIQILYYNFFFLFAQSEFECVAIKILFWSRGTEAQQRPIGLNNTVP